MEKEGWEKESWEREAVQLLQDLIGIRTVNGKDGEKPAAEYICQYLNSRGVEAFVQDIGEGRGNVIALIQGAHEGKGMIWNGHLDTVDYGSLESWDRPPWTPVMENGCLFGRGASDMKSGLAAMVYVLGKLGETGQKPGTTIQFLGTCDEERGGTGARAIISGGYMMEGSVLLIGEPTGCTVGIGQKGCIWLELEVKGKTSHGAYPEEGCNAVSCAYEAAECLGNWIRLHDHPVLGRATAQITEIQGGIQPNMTPDLCTVLMDIRTVPGLTCESILSRLETIFQDISRKYGGIPGLVPRIKNHRISIEADKASLGVATLVKSMEAAGIPEAYSGISYFTDASILAEGREGLTTLLFGPGSADMAHKPNECVRIPDYLRAIGALTNMAAVRIEDESNN
ncbi:M20 family metallopeptidase [Lacrimispora saccharolytica]|uniref:Acetylornithine deacetylase or succinyl-diaminopimelate desuccinylase n=1 Tax=Lacrimispora saccharolytica (strain ATCC 35040 / DSM 2544 / NRCC 2533 / WM1) TaxID=610130 RepID=D9R8S3_LACSW|nr:M20 family metallopeptidase [Lacrimispora saccharolytica]ADL05802.1 acetylornithine deacetylase or succinyl-diaminopimelate desuccinylase [[Clostridium] saccharolyticum WM1]